MDKIKSVTEAFSQQPKTWSVGNDLTGDGTRVIHRIQKELATDNAPPDFNRRYLAIRAYDEKGSLMFEWNPDSVNLEFF